MVWRRIRPLHERRSRGCDPDVNAAEYPGNERTLVCRTRSARRRWNFENIRHGEIHPGFECRDVTGEVAVRERTELTAGWVHRRRASRTVAVERHARHRTSNELRSLDE